MSIHDVPVICIGDDLEMTLFCPSCPLLLLPQAHKVLSFLNAKLCIHPVEILHQEVPAICIGYDIHVVLD